MTGFQWFLVLRGPIWAFADNADSAVCQHAVKGAKFHIVSLTSTSIWIIFNHFHSFSRSLRNVFAMLAAALAAALLLLVAAADVSLEDVNGRDNRLDSPCAASETPKRRKKTLRR